MQAHKPIKQQEERVSVQPSTAVLHCFFKSVLPKQLKAQSKWCHWWSALKSDFQNKILGDILYLGDRVAHCWVSPSEKRPSDMFSVIKLLKNVLQIALAQTMICSGSGKHLPLTITWMKIDPLKHSGWRDAQTERSWDDIYSRERKTLESATMSPQLPNFPWENGLDLFSYIRSSHGQC